MDEDIVKRFKKLVDPSDYGDIRLAEHNKLSIRVENGSVNSVSKSLEKGFGIRIRKNGVWGFASSNKTDTDSLKNAVRHAYKLINVTKQRSITNVEFKPELNNSRRKPEWKKDPRDVDAADKLRMILDAQKVVRDKRIVSNLSDYGESVSEWMVGSTENNFVSFFDSHPRLVISLFVKDDNTIQAVRNSLGGNRGFELFEQDAVDGLVKKTEEEALRLFNAKPVVGGKYDVVLDPSMTGVYTHEAFGHATEADGIINGTSVLEGKLEKKVGNEIVNIVDDPTINGARGSFIFDQEGTTAKRRTLVENGVLKNYLTGLESAQRLGLEPNGAARAMDYSCPPIVRMSNTFIKPGTFSDDITEDIKKGVAFYGFQYGYVDPGSGKFMFKAQYGRMIKNGKLGEYVRDAALTGFTLDVLNRIDAIGKNFALDDGTCGKERQWVPVTSGGPNIRIRSVVVGGQ